MSKLFLSLAIFLICVCCIQVAFIQYYKFDVDDFYAPSLDRFLKYVENNNLDISFDKTHDTLVDTVDSLKSIFKDISDLIDDFKEPNRNLIDNAITSINIMFESFTAFFKVPALLLFKLLHVVLSLLFDTLDCILFFINMVSYFLIPLAKIAP